MIGGTLPAGSSEGGPAFPCGVGDRQDTHAPHITRQRDVFHSTPEGCQDMDSIRKSSTQYLRFQQERRSRQACEDIGSHAHYF